MRIRKAGRIGPPDWHEIGDRLPVWRTALPGAGFYEISGLAWSGAGAIRKVEISTDGGQHWHDAELRSPAYPMATQASVHWMGRKDCVLMSRLQPMKRAPFADRVAEVAKYWTTRRRNPGGGNDNPVQPWKVASAERVEWFFVTLH